MFDTTTYILNLMFCKLPNRDSILQSPVDWSKKKAMFVAKGSRFGQGNEAFTADSDVQQGTNGPNKGYKLIKLKQNEPRKKNTPLKFNMEPGNDGFQ